MRNLGFCCDPAAQAAIQAGGTKPGTRSRPTNQPDRSYKKNLEEGRCDAILTGFGRVDGSMVIRAQIGCFLGK